MNKSIRFNYSKLPLTLRFMNSKLTPCRIFMDTSSTRNFSSIFYHPVSFTLRLVPHARTGSPCRTPMLQFQVFCALNKRPLMGSEVFTFLTICRFSLFVFGLFHTSRPRFLLITFALKEPHYIIVLFSFHQCTVCVRNVTSISIREGKIIGR